MQALSFRCLLLDIKVLTGWKLALGNPFNPFASLGILNKERLERGVNYSPPCQAEGIECFPRLPVASLPRGLGLLNGCCWAWAPPGPLRSMLPKLLQVVAQAPEAKCNQLGGWRKGTGCLGKGMTSWGKPLQLFPLCVGGSGLPICSRLGPGTPNHSMEGFWGHCERFWERSLNTLARTRQLEALKVPTGVPAPHQLRFGFFHFADNWSIVFSRTWWSGSGKGLLLVRRGRRGVHE